MSIKRTATSLTAKAAAAGTPAPLPPSPQSQVAAALASGLQTAQKTLAAKLLALQTAAGPKPAPDTSTRIAHYQALSKAITTLNQEHTSLPTPSRGSFIIHGRIVDASGKPLPNYLLKLSDPTQTLQARIAPVPSNEQGFFTVTLRAAEFPDLVEKKTNLFLTVTDQSGREAYAPDAPLQLVAGQMAVFSAVDQPGEAA